MQRTQELVGGLRGALIPVYNCRGLPKTLIVGFLMEQTRTKRIQRLEAKARQFWARNKGCWWGWLWVTVAKGGGGAPSQAVFSPPFNFSKTCARLPAGSRNSWGAWSTLGDRSGITKWLHSRDSWGEAALHLRSRLKHTEIPCPALTWGSRCKATPPATPRAGTMARTRPLRWRQWCRLTSCCPSSAAVLGTSRIPLDTASRFSTAVVGSGRVHSRAVPPPRGSGTARDRPGGVSRRLGLPPASRRSGTTRYRSAAPAAAALVGASCRRRRPSVPERPLLRSRG